jgi:hypothetical protein
MDMAGHECLVVSVQDLGLEFDRAVAADFDLRVALSDRGRASGLILRRQLRLQDAHHT